MAEEVTYASLSLPQTHDVPQPVVKQNSAVNKRPPSWLLVTVALGVVTLVNILITLSLVFFNLERFSTKENIQNLTDELQRTNSFLQAWDTIISGGRQFCMIGWLQNDGHCYYFSRRKYSWEQSRKFCETQDADMLMIKDNRTLSFIREHSNGTGYFVGLNKERSGWRWIDGTTVDTFFSIHKSDNTYKCARVSSGELWQESCTKNFQCICEKNACKIQ